MKKGLIYLSAFALFACGNEESTVTLNDGEQSSVVETTNPELTSTGEEHFEGDGHDHGTESGEAAAIKYVTEKHDFGTVFYPSDNMYSFKFTNTGKVPLVIKEATASCGCTIPNKPEEPILPGETGVLDVIFRPKEGQVGQTVTKKITVTANTVPAETYLEISATVVQAM